MVLSSSEKLCVERFSGPVDFSLNIPLEKLLPYKRNYFLSGQPDVKFINTGNLDYLKFSLLYHFSPNAVSSSVPAGSVVIFANVDDQAHRIVATDGAFDTGVLDPGRSSAPIAPSANGAYYYCTVHPQEVGSIAASTGTQAREPIWWTASAYTEKPSPIESDAYSPKKPRDVFPAPPVTAR